MVGTKAPPTGLSKVVQPIKFNPKVEDLIKGRINRMGAKLPKVIKLKTYPDLPSLVYNGLIHGLNGIEHRWSLFPEYTASGGFTACWTNGCTPPLYLGTPLYRWIGSGGAGPVCGTGCDSTSQFPAGSAMNTGTVASGANLLSLYRGPIIGGGGLMNLAYVLKRTTSGTTAGPKLYPGVGLPLVIPGENPMAVPEVIPILQPIAPTKPLPITHPGVFPKPGEMPAADPKPEIKPDTSPGQPVPSRPAFPSPDLWPDLPPVFVTDPTTPGANPVPIAPPVIVVDVTPDGPPIVTNKPPPAVAPTGGKPGGKIKHEGKLNVKSLGGAGTAIWIAGNAFSEGVDAVDAIFKGIPEGHPALAGMGPRPDKANPYDKAKAILAAAGDINWPQAIAALINNQVEDAAYGGIGKMGNKANQISGAATGGGHAVGVGADYANEYEQGSAKLPIPTVKTNGTDWWIETADGTMYGYDGH